jgi:hypothetical protein
MEKIVGTRFPLCAKAADGWELGQKTVALFGVERVHTTSLVLGTQAQVDVEVSASRERRSLDLAVPLEHARRAPTSAGFGETTVAGSGVQPGDARSACTPLLVRV